jgi:membrane fusion protein (multidrug efflux system)
MPTHAPIEPRPIRWRLLLLSGLIGLTLLGGAFMMFQKSERAPASEENASAPAQGTAGSIPGDTTPPVGPTGDAQARLTAVEVQVAKPIRRDVTYSISLPANVAPLYQTTLYAKVAGYLKWIGPDKGDRVKKDQVLAIIDAPEVEEQYHQAVADYKIKKLTYERLANVWKETPDVIAKQDVDVAEAAFEGAKHLMDQRTVLRDYMKVRAPYSGLITARFADPGAMIQIATSSATSASPVFTIMDIETVRIYTNVPQDDAPMVRAGTAVIVTVKELVDRPFTATVTRTTLSLDPSTRTMLVEIDLPNQDHALQPGTFAEVTLMLRQSPNALVIPPGSIVSNGKTKSVFVVEQGRAKLVPIITGLSDGRWVEITQGLNGTEDVVVVGKTRLTEGTLVRAAPYNLPEGTPSVQKFDRRSAGASASSNPPPPLGTAVPGNR